MANPNKWLLHGPEGWLELNYSRDDYLFRLYASFGKIVKGERSYFAMNRDQLKELRDKINDALDRQPQEGYRVR